MDPNENPKNRSQEKIKVKVDPEFEDLIPVFMANRRRDITLMMEALKDKNFELIQRLGHGMKGAGSGYGMDQVTEIGKALEEAAKERNSSSIENWIEELSFYIEHIEVIYEQR